jgi:hypothetical protein
MTICVLFTKPTYIYKTNIYTHHIQNSTIYIPLTYFGGYIAIIRCISGIVYMQICVCVCASGFVFVRMALYVCVCVCV